MVFTEGSISLTTSDIIAMKTDDDVMRFLASKGFPVDVSGIYAVIKSGYEVMRSYDSSRGEYVFSWRRSK